ncbi:hypothetical protein CFN79_13915 [Chromobacterium vaccinii]|uniref:hypothetical protein n=1 Tax=Chromobacterium vaccinii TaxID=1108595 RepID=UPI000CE96C49|nr:hypothetical protein [Chromobacterium vaccinii]AVG16858.1 hypothetical protein CFN79_13915 [Chromobacterium vaccinii]
MRIVPDWLIQTIWWISGIFATGALWYFISIKDYSSATGSGAAAVIFAMIAIALHRRKDQLAEQAIPAEFKESLPDDYVRRLFDDPSDVRLFQSLPDVKAVAYSAARAGWDTGITIEMRKASYDVVDFYEFVWLKLAEFYPPKHFGQDGANAYIRQYIRDRYKFHWAKHEPNGAGTGGTIVGVLTGGDVVDDLDRLIVETATAIVGYRDNFDFALWLQRWKSSSPLSV